MARILRIGLPILALALLAVGAYVGLVWAPPDRDMGDVQRIMYVHVPAAEAALFAFIATFLASVAYLFRPRWGLDAFAEATAEVGCFFNALLLVLGSIWGRPTWGVWWTWDPRLTSAAVMLVLFTGYLTLRRFMDDPERRATWSAVVAIFASVDLPIVYFSVRWWRSLHQIQSNAMTVDRRMGAALGVNMLALLTVLACFVWFRYRIALAARKRELAEPEDLPSTQGATP